MYVKVYPPPSINRVFVATKPEEALNVGELVILEFVGRKHHEKNHRYKVLGLVVSSRFEDVLTPIDTPQTLKEYIPEEAYYVSSVYLVGEIEGGKIVPLSLAPPVGTPVRRVTDEDLKEIFGDPNDPRYIKLGKIPNIDIRVSVPLTEIATKHLAVLAVTGAGKSNTVARIIKQILQDERRILPIIVFDFHGEYDIGIPGIEKKTPYLNPRILTEEEAYIMFDIPENAHIERGFFREAFESTKRLSEILEETGRKPSAHAFIAMLLGTLLAMEFDIITTLSRDKTLNKYLSRFSYSISNIFRRFIRSAPGIKDEEKELLAGYYITSFVLMSKRLLEIYEEGLKNKKMEKGTNVTSYFIPIKADGSENKITKIGNIEIEEEDGKARFRSYTPPLMSAKSAKNDIDVIRTFNERYDLHTIFNTIDLEELKERIEETMKDLIPPLTLSASPSQDIQRIMNLIRKVLFFYSEFYDLLGTHERVDAWIENAFSRGRSIAYVIDLSRYGTSKADVLVSIYLREAFEYAKEYTLKNRPRVNALIVLEEAHNFIGVNASGFSRPIAERIMREGRKYGVGMIIVSQRPRKLDTNVMSQVNNYIILKITLPEDQDYVRDLTESMPNELARSLSNLRTGEALLIGPMVKFPIIVQIEKVKEKKAGITPEVYIRRESISDIDLDEVFERFLSKNRSLSSSNSSARFSTIPIKRPEAFAISSAV